MRRLTFAAITLMLLATAIPATARQAFPEVIPLPDGFAPEGVAIGGNHTFYTGSLADGAIVSGDLRTGEIDLLVPGEPGRLAVGMDVDRRSGHLFVAGGLNGVGRVYDTRTGALEAEIPMGAGFVNDVIVTRDGAYFTNSFAPEIYRVPLGPAGRLGTATVETITLSGDWVQVPGPFVFNANGIVATPDGDTLIVVNSALGSLYAVDPMTGEASTIDLGGDGVPSGDGLVLLGQALYVVQNQLNQIAVVSLDADLELGEIVDVIVSPDFDIPTTADVFGGSLYAVNAKFGTDPIGTPYEVVKVPRN